MLSTGTGKALVLLAASRCSSHVVERACHSTLLVSFRIGLKPCVDGAARFRRFAMAAAKVKRFKTEFLFRCPRCKTERTFTTASDIVQEVLICRFPQSPRCTFPESHGAQRYKKCELRKVVNRRYFQHKEGDGYVEVDKRTLEELAQRLADSSADESAHDSPSM